MRMKILLLLLLAWAPAQAGVLYSHDLDASVDNLNTTFSVSDGTKITMTNATKFGGELCIVNATAAVIAANVDNDLGTAAPTAGVNDVYIPANWPYCFPAISRVTRTILLRSATGGVINLGHVYTILTDRRG